MGRILVAKHLSSLRPADAIAEAAIHGLKQGEIVTVELVRPRNIQHHRKFFAMLQTILENQEYYKSVEDLLDVCKLRIGHCRTITTARGDVKIPKSISFASMDQVAFDAFYNRACEWVLSEVIPGLQRQHLDEEVEANLRAFGG